MSPEIGPVRQRLVVDFDDAVRLARQRIAGLQIEFEDSVLIAINAQFLAAGQHAIALHPADGGLADFATGERGSARDVSRYNARAAVRSAADHSDVPPASVDNGLPILAAWNRLGRQHSGCAYGGEVHAVRLNSVALGRLHRD